MEQTADSQSLAVRLAESWAQFAHQQQANTKRLKACFFDMDGVIFDSMPSHAQSWVGATAHYGIASREIDFYHLEGQLGADTIRQLVARQFDRAATEAEIEGVYKLKTELFVKLRGHKPMPGAAECLAAVRDAGLKLVLVTGSAQSSLFERLERMFPGVFGPANMITGLDVQCGKPHPEPYQKALELLALQPEEALVIENAPLGIRSARAAGIFTLAVNTGPLGEADLARAGASCIASTMAETAAAFRQFLPLVASI